METPDKIYLIDMGEDVVWCDSPDPHPDMDPDDAIAYVRESQLSEAQETIKEQQRRLEVLYDGTESTPALVKIARLEMVIEDRDAVIKRLTDGLTNIGKYGGVCTDDDACPICIAEAALTPNGEG